MVITLPVSSLGIWVWEGKPGYRFILNTNGHRSYFVVTMTKEDSQSAWPSEWGSPCSLPASLCLIWFFWFYFWLWTAAPRDCSAQLCPVLCSRMDCGPPGSSAHAGFPARMREWGATSYCRGPSEPGVEPASPALAGQFFTTSVTWETQCLLSEPKQRLMGSWEHAPPTCVSQMLLSLTLLKPCLLLF